MNLPNPIAQGTAGLVSDRLVSNSCPACGVLANHEGIAILDHEYGLSYVARYIECRACATLFQEAMPTVSELAAFYPSDYHSMIHAGWLNRIRNDVRIRRLKGLLTGEGAILDYGCGDGAFLAQAAERMPHRHFWGFEIAESAATTVLAEGRVTLVRGSLPNLLATLPACSLITLNHVIEHLPDPLTVVTALVERLLPGGVFEGQTPAADSLERSIFGRRWSGYHAPRHTVIFSRRGLCLMLERSGLSAPAVRGAFNPASLAVSLGSLPHREAGRIRRSGLKWLSLLVMAGALSPVDLWSGRPGIMDFVAYKRAN